MAHILCLSDVSIHDFKSVTHPLSSRLPFYLEKYQRFQENMRTVITIYCHLLHSVSVRDGVPPALPPSSPPSAPF